MTARHKPSVHQQAVLDHLRAVGRTRLYRWPGGYWVDQPCPDQHRVNCPEWYTLTTTVAALERGGWLRRTGQFADPWRDTRELVP